MRTFHIGGAASRAAIASSVEAKSEGRIGFNSTMRYVTNAKGELVVISRSGEIIISDPHGRERERHKVPYGATLNIKADQQIKAGTILGNWDPLTRPIITEFAGKMRFENVEEGVTVAKQVDEVTGLSTLVVIDPKRRGSVKVVRPQVKLLDFAGQEVKIPGTDHSVTIGFPIGCLIQVRDGQDVMPGEVLARIPIEGQKTRDITGGLPRVAELFEARTPKAARAALAEMTGRRVSFGKETKGKGSPADHRPGTAASPRNSCRRKRTSWCTKARWSTRASRSSTVRPIRRTSCAFWASRNWRATSSTKCRTCTDSRA